MEIERKWKIDYFASDYIEEYILQQIYILVKNEHEIRMRSSYNTSTNKTEYTLTFKIGTGMARSEYEYSIPESLFVTYYETFEYPGIKKIRRIYEEGLCVDRYYDYNLILLEKEFDTVEEAKAYVLPEWAKDAVDVTLDTKYKNRNLAKMLKKETIQ